MYCKNCRLSFHRRKYGAVPHAMNQVVFSHARHSNVCPQMSARTQLQNRTQTSIIFCNAFVTFCNIPSGKRRQEAVSSVCAWVRSPKNPWIFVSAFFFCVPVPFCCLFIDQSAAGVMTGLPLGSRHVNHRFIIPCSQSLCVLNACGQGPLPV